MMKIASRNICIVASLLLSYFAKALSQCFSTNVCGRGDRPPPGGVQQIHVPSGSKIELTCHDTVVTSGFSSGSDGRDSFTTLVGDGCIRSTAECDYAVQWHRVAGCDASWLPTNSDNGRWRQSFGATTVLRNNVLSISPVAVADSGLWLCQLVGTAKAATARAGGGSALPVMTVVYKLFSVHVDRRVVECAQLDAGAVRCPPAHACASMLTPSSSPTINLNNPNAIGSNAAGSQPVGCVNLDDLPAAVYSKLVGPPETVCTTVVGRRACHRTPIIGEQQSLDGRPSNVHCCYCFGDRCNVPPAAVDYATLSWRNLPSKDGKTLFNGNGITLQTRENRSDICYQLSMYQKLYNGACIHRLRYLKVLSVLSICFTLSWILHSNE